MSRAEPVANRGGRQDAIVRFGLARDAISGLDQNGNRVSLGWFHPSVISLAHGEGVRRPHPSVVGAGVRALLDSKESSLDNYLYLRPFERLDEKLVQMFLDEGVDPSVASNLCLDSGNTRLFFGFFRSVAQPGDVFLTQRGYYQAINMWCDLSDVTLKWVETDRREDYKLTAESLEEWYDRNVRTGLSPAPRGLILFNPSYTGALYDQEELLKLADFVDRHDLVVLEDSIFVNTEFPGHRTVHLAGIEEVAHRVVTLNGGSKAYGLANIRIGWGCGPTEIIERMNYYSMASSITVPHLAKAMLLAALEAPRAYLDGNIREGVRRAGLVAALVDELNGVVANALGFVPEVPFFEVAHEPKASHSTLLSGNGMGGLELPTGGVVRDSLDVTRYFLAEANVCFSPGISNGFDDCTVRVSWGCLGWEHTYPEVEASDTRAAATALLERLAGPARDQLAGVLPGVGAYRDEYNEGFEGGRAQLRDALLNRAAPAAVRLALHNKTALAERCMVS